MTELCSLQHYTSYCSQTGWENFIYVTPKQHAAYNESQIHMKTVTSANDFHLFMIAVIDDNINDENKL